MWRVTLKFMASAMRTKKSQRPGEKLLEQEAHRHQIPGQKAPFREGSALRPFSRNWSASASFFLERVFPQSPDNATRQGQKWPGSGHIQNNGANQMIGSFLREHLLFPGMGKKLKFLRPAGTDIYFSSDLSYMGTEVCGKKVQVEIPL